MKMIKTLQAKAREQWALLVGPKSNQFDQNKALNDIIASTIKEFGEEVLKKEKELRQKAPNGAIVDMEHLIRSLTETV